MCVGGGGVGGFLYTCYRLARGLNLEYLGPLGQGTHMVFLHVVMYPCHE